MVKFFNTILGTMLALSVFPAKAQDNLIQIILTSDVHYGITRSHFRGADSVSAVVVNEAMIDVFDRLPGMVMPVDKGVGSGKKIKYIDAVTITGDIANREEAGIQSAADSWRQF